MSRIGKNPIAIPDNVQINIEGNVISAKGPLGELSLQYNNAFELAQQDKHLVVKPKNDQAPNSALWGLYRALIANIIKGVADGFNKRLIIEGVGYRAEVKGKDLVLSLGFSHPVVMPIPDGLKVEIEKLTIIISGADKQQVGQFAANIRAQRKPEPYKGKGIRYDGEKIRRKAGKRVAAGVGVK